jgi:UDP-N-acetyl-D-glucosamine dehydrogenase
VLGVAYKRNISDVRESPALDILQLLANKGAKLSYCDPYVPFLDEHGIRMKAEKFTPATLRKADCVVLVTDHDLFDRGMIVRESKVVVDTRNALSGRNGKKVIKL